MAIKIDVDDREIQAKLKKLELDGGDLVGPMNVIGRKITTRVKLGFRSSVSPWGQAWAPLKRRSGQPLRDTGRLMASITYRTGKDGDSSFVDVGTNVRYAPIHQFGGTIKIAARSQHVYRQLLKTGAFKRGFVKKSRSNFAQGVTIGAHEIVIPARPFLPLTDNELSLPDSWEGDVMTSLRAHLRRKVQE